MKFSMKGATTNCYNHIINHRFRLGILNLLPYLFLLGTQIWVLLVIKITVICGVLVPTTACTTIFPCF